LLDIVNHLCYTIIMKERKTEKIMIRLTAEEKAVLAEEAEKRGITLTALVRMILFENLPALRG